MKRFPNAIPQRLGICALAFVLALSSTPCAGFADDTDTEALTAGTTLSSDSSGSESNQLDTTPWYDRIDAMLGATGTDVPTYTEGEVIATVVVENEGDGAKPLGDGATYENLYWSTGDAYEGATGRALSENVLKLAQAWYKNNVTCSSDVHLVHMLVRSDTQSTREILLQLKEQTTIEGIVDAEPNYSLGSDDLLSVPTGSVDQTDDDEASGDESDAVALASTSDAATGSYAPTTQSIDVTGSMDASTLQWAYGSTSGNYRNLYNALSTVQIEGWNKESAADVGGVVAVLDTGVDYTHPDLAGCMFDMTGYKDKTVNGEAVGGGKYGYNAVSSTDHTDPLDDNGHGTHVAGIVAASQNGYGITGTVKGTKLLAVKAASATGDLATDDALAGYQYLKRVKLAGVDLRAVNNSWCGDGARMSTALYTAIYDLGRMGVLSVFASGNNAANVDKESYTPYALASNPYVLEVNSIDMDDNPSSFSNRGKRNTDLYAPGSSIYSTIPTNTGTRNKTGSLTASDGTYVPSIMGGTVFETFKGSTGTIKAYYQNGSADPVYVGSYDGASGFDRTGGCLSIAGSTLASITKPSDATETNAKKRIVLEIPVTEAQLQGVSEVGVALNLTGISTSNAWLEVQTSAGKWIKQRYGSTEVQAVADGTWGTVSINLTKACNSWLRGNATPQIGVFTKDGQTYIKVSLCLGYKNGYTIDSGGSLKIDCIGLGNTVWHYGYKTGTSQAAPLVSGLAAMAYNAVNASGSVADDIRAQKVANVLRTTATKQSALAGMCSTGGLASASGYAAAVANDTTTPYIGSVTVSGERTIGGKTYTVLSIKGENLAKDSGISLICDYNIGDWYTAKKTNTEVEILLLDAAGYKNLCFVASGTGSASQASMSVSMLTVTSEDEPDTPNTPDTPSDNTDNDTGGKEEAGDGTENKADGSVKKTAAKTKVVKSTAAMPATGDDQMGIVAVIAVAGAACIAAAIVIIVRQRKR